MINKSVAIGLLVMSTFFGYHHPSAPLQLAPVEDSPGKQWLKWTAQEQATFVDAYIDGYLAGMETACLSADKLFETRETHRLGHDNVASAFPSSRCRSSVDKYTRSGNRVPNIYATIITLFYKNNPQYEGIPYSYLMEYLKDSKASTAAELGAMAKQGKIRTTFR